jgi:non-ribosomal peptide synthetase component F
MTKLSQIHLTHDSSRNRVKPDLSTNDCPWDQLGKIDVDFWKAQLAGAPAMLELPTDRPRPTVLSYAGACVGLAFTAELTAGLRWLSQRHSTTLGMTLLAGWSALLSRLSGQTDLVIGTPVAHFGRSELAPLSGLLSDALPVRVRLEQDPSVAELLSQIKASSLEAYAHRNIPFVQLVEVLQSPRSLSCNPIFQVLLALDNAPADRQDTELRLRGSRINDLAAAHITAQFDLTLSLRDTEERIVGVLTYACDLFHCSTIERMVEQLRTLFESMIADDQQHVSELQLLPREER